VTPGPAAKGVCLLVTNIDAPSGGIQKNSRLLLSELNKRGIATYVCVRNYHGLPRDEVVDGTVIHRSPVLGGSMALNGILYFLDVLFWLIRNRSKYDLIHCQQMFGPTMAAAMASYVIHKPILTRVTTVGELGEVKQIREMPLSGLRMRLIRRVTAWAALTKAMKEELVDLGVPGERVRIIYNSTAIGAEVSYSAETKAALRKQLNLPESPIAVFVGRLSEEKNLDVLIQAWPEVLQQFPSAQLLLLGEGGAYRNVEPRLRAIVGSLGLSTSVQFRGHVANAKDYVVAADVFVLPSRTEGMSNALVEALSCGTAIVATDIPANAEICTHEVDALLVPVGDRPALASAITKLFGSASLALEFGTAARRKAEDALSVDRMVEAYLDAYEDMLGQCPG
jgi:glycosyltransferase involved in cell wall biosynthesis